MSLKDAILTAADTASEKVTVPEWGGIIVTVREMSGTDREQWEQVAFPKGEARPECFRAALLVATLYDDAGNRVFGPADLPALSAKSAAVLSRLYDVAARLNALRPKDVPDAAKNS